ncbi:MAG TPA: hypothetical protein PLK76_03525 [bacterium]|nr:hypothetical protein [bacterium]
MSFNVQSFRPQHNFPSAMPAKRNGSTGKKKTWWRKIIYLTLIILGVYLLFTYVLARVKVLIIPDIEDRAKEFNVQLNTNNEQVNESNNIFKAEIIAAEETKEDTFSATGSKNLGDYANGQVLLTNKTGLSQPLTKDTDLVSDNGKVFHLTADTTIPGAKVDETGQVIQGEISVAIKAKEAGTASNNINGRINIGSLPLDKQEKIYGLISGNTVGGSDKTERVVSEDDLNKAQDKLSKDLEVILKEKINKKVSPDLVISEQLINFSIVELTKEFEIDAKADNFKMSLKLKARTFAYDNKHMRQVLKERMTQDLKSGEVIAEGELGDLNLEVVQANYDLGLVDLKIKATFPVAENMALEEIKNNILGKNEAEARRYILSLPKVKDVRFIFSWNLSSKVPNSATKVNVVLSKDGL